MFVSALFYIKEKLNLYTFVRGSIGKGHVHMLIGCSPNIATSKIMQYLKGRLSRKFRLVILLTHL